MWKSLSSRHFYTARVHRFGSYCADRRFGCVDLRFGSSLCPYADHRFGSNPIDTNTLWFSECVPIANHPSQHVNNEIQSD